MMACIKKAMSRLVTRFIILFISTGLISIGHFAAESSLMEADGSVQYFNLYIGEWINTGHSYRGVVDEKVVEEPEVEKTTQQVHELEVAVIMEGSPPIDAETIEYNVEEELITTEEPSRRPGIIIRNSIIAALALVGIIGFTRYHLMKKAISGNSIDSW